MTIASGQLILASDILAIQSTANGAAPLANPSFVGTVTIPGGTINNTIIGAVTPAAGAFSQLTLSPASGNASIQNSTTTAIALGNSVNGDMIRVNDRGISGTSWIDFSYLNGTNTYVMRNGGTAANFRVESQIGGALSLGASTGNLVAMTNNGTTVGQFSATGLNGCVIGATTPAAGTFAALSATGTTTHGTNAAVGAIVSNGPAGTFRSIFWQTAGLNRWYLAAINDAESGSNVGSSFVLQRMNDAGTGVDNPIVVSRATGLVTMGKGAAITGGTSENHVIGATTAAAGTFTALTTTGNVSLTKGVAVSGGAVALPAPPAAIATTTYTVAATDVFLVFNGAASCTVTLPTVASSTGRILWVKTVAAFTVISASSNVAPRTSTTAGTAILAAAAGSWAHLICDGTNWIVMAGA